MLLPSNPAQPASMMAQAFSIYKQMIVDQSENGPTEMSKSKVEIEDLDSSLGISEKSNSTPKPAEDERVVDPVFSLQSPKSKK